MMEYYITVTKGKDTTIIRRHTNLNEAIEAGKSFFEESNHRGIVSCIAGKVNSDGEIEGQYRLYKSWY